MAIGVTCFPTRAVRIPLCGVDPIRGDHAALLVVDRAVFRREYDPAVNSAVRVKHEFVKLIPGILHRTGTGAIEGVDTLFRLRKLLFACPLLCEDLVDF